MIREITILDEKSFKYLGSQINEKFNNVYSLKNELNNELSTIMIYVDNSLIKGFIHYNDLDENIDILNVVVDKEYRHQSIGSQLLAYLIDNCNAKSITLEVSKENINAIKLYKKFNFNSVGIRKEYYNGIDAITMIKYL